MGRASGDHRFLSGTVEMSYADAQKLPGQVRNAPATPFCQILAVADALERIPFV
jgi:hypothetical protein